MAEKFHNRPKHPTSGKKFPQDPKGGHLKNPKNTNPKSANNPNHPRKPTVNKGKTTKTSTSSYLYLRIALNVILDLLFAAAMLILPQFLIYFPMRWLLGSDFSHPIWSAVYSITSYLLGLIMLLLWFKLRSKQHSKKHSENHPRTLLGLTDLPKWSDIGLAPIGLAVYTFFATILTGLFSKFPFFNATEAQDLGFGTHLYFPQDKIFVFIAIVIVAPIVEELIFRGWLYARLRARIPGRASMLTSILLTSILFGLLHGQWNVGVNVFCLSVVLCLLREITGTTYAGILLHIAKNFIAFFLVYLL